MTKAFRFIGIAAAFLFLGLTVPANSRQDRQDNSRDNESHQKQDKQAEKQQQSKPERQSQPQAKGQQDQQWQQHMQAKGQRDQPRQQQQQQQARSQQDRQRQQQQRQDIQSARQRNPEQVRQQQVAWQGDRAHNWQSDHRTWQQRGGYKGYRVTDDRFRAYYGPDHQFRIFSLPVVFVGGQRRFHYGAYWFGFVDPWPEYWSNNWYDNDDLWVDYYAGGYYLCNRSHPDDRIAISFYLN